MSEPASDLYRAAPAGPRPGSWKLWGLPRRWGGWGLFTVLLLYLALALASAHRKSVTVDELGHLPSGFYYLKTGDPRYSSLNPPLINALSALPVLLLDLPTAPAPAPSDDPFSFWSTGYAFLQLYRDDYLRIYDAARWMPILTVAALGALLFAWARRLAPQAPDAAGVLAAGFVCLSPNVLAQARLVGTDTGTAFFTALAVFGMHMALLRPSNSRVLAWGVTLGLAQLTKFYALLLYPTMLGVVIGWHILSPRLSHGSRPRLQRLLAGYAAAVVVSLVVLNTGYLWREFGASLSQLPVQSSTLETWQASPLGTLPIPLPAAYLRAFDAQLVELDSQIPSFLLGERFEGGRWYYYLATLAIKTPLPLFVVFGLALALSLQPLRLPRRELLLLLAYPLCLFVLQSLSDRRQLGARALLSAVPFVQLWAAATIARSWPKRWPLIAATAALAWTLAVSVRSYPDYLAYFNPLVGGSEQGYRYASDANLDIGQDLVQLSEYLSEARGEVAESTTGQAGQARQAEKVQLLYFGSVDPALYGIDYKVPSSRLEPGLFAVSVSLYHTDYLMFDHGKLRAVGPVIVEGLGEPVSIGGSIHVYRVGP